MHLVVNLAKLRFCNCLYHALVYDKKVNVVPIIEKKLSGLRKKQLIGTRLRKLIDIKTLSTFS